MHRGRVAARRLRSLLKTFRPLLESRRARLYRVDLRSFARGLAGSIPPADLEQLASLLEDACIAARDALHRHQREPGWASLLAALERHA